MTKNIIESWITTGLGTLVGLFGFATFWFDKTSLWETIPMWFVGAILIFANETYIKKLVDKLPKFK